MRALVVGLSVIAGCGRIGFAPSATPLDGPGPGSDAVPADALGPNAGFGTPVGLGVFDADPQLRADGLELWTSTAFELLSAARATPMEPFMQGAPVVNLNSAANDLDPALSADGQVLMFVSTRTGSSRLYEARRTVSSDVFAAPTLVLGLEATNVYALDLLPDGNTLYVDAGVPGVLVRTTRPDRATPFGARTQVAVPAKEFPTVSADELVMFANVSATEGVMWATRETTDQPFTYRGPLDVGGACARVSTQDADFTPDGLHLILRCPEVTLLTR